MTPALLAAYAALPFPPFRPSNEAILIMHPDLSSVTMTVANAIQALCGERKGLTTSPTSHHTLSDHPTAHDRSHQIRLHYLIQQRG